MRPAGLVGMRPAGLVGMRPAGLVGMRPAGLALAALLAISVGGCECGGPRQSGAPTIERGAPYTGQPRVWVVSDGAQVTRDAGTSPLMQGSVVWTPGAPVELFGLREETLGFQVVVTAGSAKLQDVAVRLGRPDQPCWVAEAFVVHELPMKRRSGGATVNQSLGWTAAAIPPSVAAGGALPDVLIPVDIAPPWADYPMTVAAGTHRVVWFDLQLAPDAPAGDCRADIEVTVGNTALATVPVHLEVGAQTLPYRSLKTMVYFAPDELRSRIDDERAIALQEQLLHAHQLSSVVPLRSAEDVRRHGYALDGSLFTHARGYRGPGVGVRADVAAIGAYGSLGDPTAASLSKVAEVVDALDKRGVAAPESDVFVYAVDEQCDSPRGADWRRALNDAGGKLARLKVGHTCSRPPAQQPVDVVMVFSGEYDVATAAAARRAGKQVWIYNGALPFTGTFLTDGWPLSLRANAWIQARYNIERWFYWESTFWNDNNEGGLGPYDPLAGAETFHNKDGDHCNGDGVLVYPGMQRHGFRSLASPRVLPSVRLKQWRRGISDGGYLTLARKVDADATDKIISAIVPHALDAAKGMSAPPFSVQVNDYETARRKLFRLLNPR